MIPCRRPFGSITFGDLSRPEDRRRRCDLLEHFEFLSPSEAFSEIKGGCWRRLIMSDPIDALPYNIASFCAEYEVHIEEIGVDSWGEYFIHGKDAEEANDRYNGLKANLEHAYVENGGRLSGDPHSLFRNYRLFSDYLQYYEGKNYVRKHEVFLVFSLPDIIEHLRQEELTKIGWALWKYADQERIEFGMHPNWSFERPRDYRPLSGSDQGSGYEYTIRVLPDYNSDRHIKLANPAFMFLHQEDALAFRTVLDMLGFYDEYSKNYEPLEPVPTFNVPVTGTNSSYYSNSIRYSKFRVV